MSEFRAEKNVAYYLAVPMLQSADTTSFDDGETVTDTAYYKDGAGAWTSLAITDTFTEIASTGIYEIDLTAAEMNHDKIIIKLTATNSADSMVIINCFDGLNTSEKADVNAEVVDAIATDTRAEPGQGSPGATVAMATKIDYLYKDWRNKHVCDGNTDDLYNDAGDTKDQTRSVNSEGGITTLGEVGSGA